MRLPHIPFLVRRERVAIELDPVQVAAMRYLLKVKAAPLGKIYEHVFATHFVDLETFALAMAETAASGLTIYGTQPGTRTTFIALAPLGKKLRGKLPYGRDSAMTVYL